MEGWELYMSGTYYYNLIEKNLKSEYSFCNMFNLLKVELNFIFSNSL